MNAGQRKLRNQKICELYSSGLNSRQVAAMTGVTHRTVLNIAGPTGIVRSNGDAHRKPNATDYINLGGTHEHIAIAERVLGHSLPRGAVVHHHDGNKQNNVNSNLVICESQAYHLHLHMRMRVVAAGGNPSGERICHGCKRLTPITELRKSSCRLDGVLPYCRPCRSVKDARANQRVKERKQANARPTK